MIRRIILSLFLVVLPGCSNSEKVPSSDSPVEAKIAAPTVELLFRPEVGTKKRIIISDTANATFSPDLPTLSVSQRTSYEFEVVGGADNGDIEVDWSIVDYSDQREIRMQGQVQEIPGEYTNGDPVRSYYAPIFGKTIRGGIGDTGRAKSVSGHLEVQSIADDAYDPGQPNPAYPDDMRNSPTEPRALREEMSELLSEVQLLERLDMMFEIHPTGSSYVGEEWQNTKREGGNPNLSTPETLKLEGVTDTSLLISIFVDEARESGDNMLVGRIEGMARFDRATGLLESMNAEGEMSVDRTGINANTNPRVKEFTMLVKMDVLVR